MRIEQLIKLREIIQEPNLMSRDLANVVFSKFEGMSPSRIEVDFSDIVFISRSFADQFHKNKIAFCEQKDIEIIVVNCNDDVFNMFQEVARTNDPAFVRTYKKSRYNVWNINSRGDLRKLNFSF